MSKVNIPTKVYRKILRILPTKIALYVIFFRGYHKILNLKNPKYYGEKIQWLKLNGGLEELSDLVDKYEVRKYIKDTIGKKYLNDLYGVYDRVEDINFEELPNQFVLKCTNGSGTVIVCDDKNKLNIKKIKKEMKKWLKDKYWKEKKEFQYKNIKNRIIIEKYLENNSKSLTDYKFYCFDGKVYCYGIFYDRFINKSIDFYDRKGNKLEGVKTCMIKNSDIIEPYDKRIKNMIELSEKLAKEFTFVRVDFYYVNNQVIFGELTFTDGAGSDAWYPIEFDIEIANNIKLTKIMSGEYND